MTLTASDTGGGGDFEQAPIGVHPARCISVIDLGTQENKMYDKWERKIFITWELPTKMVSYKDKEDNEVTKPFVIGRFYTLSLGEKAHLRHHLESWRGKQFSMDELAGFDILALLGKACQVQVMHNDKDRAFVNTVPPNALYYDTSTSISVRVIN